MLATFLSSPSPPQVSHQDSEKPEGQFILEVTIQLVKQPEFLPSQRASRSLDVHRPVWGQRQADHLHNRAGGERRRPWANPPCADQGSAG